MVYKRAREKKSIFDCFKNEKSVPFHTHITQNQVNIFFQHFLKKLLKWDNASIMSPIIFQL